MAVLLDCDISTAELDTLVDKLGKKFEELGIKDQPDQKQLKNQLQQIPPVICRLVNFVFIKGKIVALRSIYVGPVRQ